MKFIMTVSRWIRQEWRIDIEADDEKIATAAALEIAKSDNGDWTDVIGTAQDHAVIGRHKVR